MSDIFSCDVAGCTATFTKHSDKKKHLVAHTNPSKIHKCPLCQHTTLYKKSLGIHMNKHSNNRPYKCPDFITVPIEGSSGSGDPTGQATLRRCDYKSNCDSGLLKHRMNKHGYIPTTRRSKMERGLVAASASGMVSTAQNNGPAIFTAPTTLETASADTHALGATPGPNTVLPSGNSTTSVKQQSVIGSDYTFTFVPWVPEGMYSPYIAGNYDTSFAAPYAAVPPPPPPAQPTRDVLAARQNALYTSRLIDEIVQEIKDDLVVMPPRDYINYPDLTTPLPTRPSNSVEIRSQPAPPYVPVIDPVLLAESELASRT